MGIKRIEKFEKIEILDEEDKVVAIAKFNPDDMNAYDKFMDLIDTISKAVKDVEKVGKIKLDNKKMGSVEEFEKNRGEFNKAHRVVKIGSETFLKVTVSIDDIFGKGVSEALTQGSMDLELLNPLIDWATPLFKKKREKKVSKYLDDEEEVL